MRRRQGVVWMRRVLAVLLVTLAILVVGGAPSGAAAAAGPGRPGAAARVDFNGDGFSDLAVGAPGENSGAGAVNILYGSAGGLAGANQTLTQVVAEAGDGFGSALAKGDFNGDQITDLAVGAPGEGVGGADVAGAVSVFYGSQSGLPATSQVLLQGNPELADQFGAALDTGSFDADVNDDLAVGAPGEGVGNASAAGAVTVFSGSANGLGGNGRVILQGNPEIGDRFGESLAAEFFNGASDSLSDLAVGAPGETVGGAEFAGAVSVFYAGPNGLPASGQAILQGNPERGDSFGSALAAGYFNQGLEADLAVGAPGETVGGRAAAGAVTVLAGTSGGLPSSGQAIVQGPGTGGSPEEGDVFGSALAGAPFDGDVIYDLAIGAPGEDLGGLFDAGVVHVLYGSAAGLVGVGQVLSQDSPGVPGNAESDDHFGGALARGLFFNDFNGQQPADLAIGVPLEDVGSGLDAGAVDVLYGSATGLPGAGAQLFTQGFGTGGQPEQFDTFGAALD
jgi:hypothetical protein